MSTKRYKPEQIVNLLRKIEVEIAYGKTTPQAAREVGITEQTYYRWRREFGGLKLEQAERLKEFEKGNSRLKRLVAELSLEKQVLRDVAQGRRQDNSTQINTGTRYIFRYRYVDWAALTTAKSLKNMVGPWGLEPQTSTVSSDL